MKVHARAAGIAFVAVLLACAPAFAKEDPYQQMAKELSDSAHLLTNPKIAIIPFKYLDKRKSPAGDIISERLTTRIVKIGKLKVIERQLLENVMQELHFETTGAVDVETTKQLGKVLGVEAIVNGTIMDVGEDRAEVNARIIKTETAEVMATASVEMAKEWTDAMPAQTVQYQQPVPQAAAETTPDGMKMAAPQEAAPVYTPAPAPATAYRKKRAGPQVTFLDIFTGGADGKMDVVFKNTKSAILTGQSMSFNLGGASYKQLKFTGAASRAESVPLGVRAAFFGKHWGGALEMSYFTQVLNKQRTKVAYNGTSATSNFDFYVDDYLKVSVLDLLSADLMYRFTDKMIQPYVGVGLGMTFNFVSSPYAYGYTNGSYGQSFNDLGIGLLTRIPMGVRFVFQDIVAFAEYRPTTNYFTFNRGIANEEDEVFMTMNYFNFGAGFKF